MARRVYLLLKDEQCIDFVKEVLKKHFELIEIPYGHSDVSKLKGEFLITDFYKWNKFLRTMANVNVLIVEKGLTFKKIFTAKNSGKVFDCLVMPLDPVYFFATTLSFYNTKFAIKPKDEGIDFEKALTFKEYKIFKLLNQNGGFITKNDIINHLWEKVSVGPKTIDVHIFNLRKKLSKFNMCLEFTNGGWKLIRGKHDTKKS